MTQSFRAVKAMREAMVEAQFTRPTVRVFYGATGTGKSFRCRKEARLNPGRTYYMPTPKKGGIPWINGYTGQETVILEDFAGSIDYRVLLRMLDEYENPMQTKGGMVQFCPKLIIISSNLHPSLWYPENEWGGGPLHRRLEVDRTGTITELTIVWDETMVPTLQPILDLIYDEDDLICSEESLPDTEGAIIDVDSDTVDEDDDLELFSQESEYQAAKSKRKE